MDRKNYYHMEDLSGKKVLEVERCFWCDNLKDDSILEEPEEAIIDFIIRDYYPCENCRKAFGNGIHVIGVTEEPNLFPIVKEEDTFLYPTGTMFIADDDFVKDMLDGQEELLNNVLRDRILFIPDELCEQIINDERELREGDEQAQGHIRMEKINHTRYLSQEEVENFLYLLESHTEEMTIEEYAEEIINFIKEKGIDRDLEITHTPTANDIILTGIKVNTGTGYDPVFDVNEAYEQKTFPDEVADALIEAFEKIKYLQSSYVEDIKDYDKIKDFIIGRVFNKDTNKEMMSKNVYAEFGDLIICFFVVFLEDERYASIQISKDIMEQWNVNLNEIIKMAYINMQNIFPLKIAPLSSVFDEEITDSDEEAAEVLQKIEDNSINMYFITDASSNNGAFYMTDKKALLEVSKVTNMDKFKIIPSSINEVIIVDNVDDESLTAMITENNRTELPQTGFLSDHFYKFDAKDEKLTMSDGTVIPFLY